jgi:MYXO-CTERM domain-containing protein
MRGVVVPAGRWSVVFQYRSSAEARGKWLSLGLGLPGLGVLAWLRRRQSAKGMSSSI